MKVKMYQLIEQIVNSGIHAGYAKAHKHTDYPNESAIKLCLAEYIMQGFDEYFEFDQEES